MPDTRTNDEIMTDIAARAAALVKDQLKPDPGAPAFTEAQEARFTELFQDLLSKTPDDHPFVQKFRHAAPDQALVGSKFSRWNLSNEDVEFLYDLQNSLIGQRRVDNGGQYQGPSDELTQAFNTVSDAAYIPEEEIRRIDKEALDKLFPRVPKESPRQRQARAQAKRAMDTAESGFGAQLVGAQYVAALWEEARPESRIVALLDEFEMTAPTAYLPVEVDIPEMLFVSESTASNSANYATVETGSNRVQVDAKKFVIHQMWSGEMEEDSIIPYIPFLRRQLALAVAHYSDSAVLNGDNTNAATGNINLVDADPPDTKHYLAFDGIRHAALVDNTANATDSAGPVTLDKLRALRGLMLDSTRLVDWGHPSDPNDLVYIADPETADAIATLDEMIMWKIQNGAPALLSGQVGQILLHPVISSMAMIKTDATGKVSTTGANNVKGQVDLFNRRGFKVGWRRRIRIETERLPGSDQTRIVASLRMGLGRFTPSGATSGIESSAVLYNIG
jgi:HK97 family phage major capsid protein